MEVVTLESGKVSRVIRVGRSGRLANVTRINRIKHRQMEVLNDGFVTAKRLI